MIVGPIVDLVAGEVRVSLKAIVVVAAILARLTFDHEQLLDHMYNLPLVKLQFGVEIEDGLLAVASCLRAIDLFSVLLLERQQHARQVVCNRFQIILLLLFCDLALEVVFDEWAHAI